MKLAIDASRANRKQRTGVEWYAFHVIRGIIRNLSAEDTLILYFQNKPREDWGTFPSNVQVKVLKWPPRILWTHIRLGFQTFIDRPHVLFIPAHVVPFFHWGKAVMTLHDIAFYYFRESYSVIQNWYQRVAIWLAKHLTRHIIAPTQTTKDDLMHVFNIHEDKMSVVWHGVESEHYNILPDEQEVTDVLEKYQINEQFLLYIGRVESKKNIIKMIQAFERVKKEGHDDLQFVLVGKPGFGYHKIIDYIKKSQFKDDIILPGWVEQNDMIILHLAAIAFFYVTLYEGFGMPILESFAAKTPVITSNRGASAEIAREYAVKVSPESINDMFFAIKNILNKRGVDEAKLQAAYHFSQSVNWGLCSEKTYNILRKVARN